jgi:hypothetical protein
LETSIHYFVTIGITSTTKIKESAIMLTIVKKLVFIFSQLLLASPAPQRLKSQQSCSS